MTAHRLLVVEDDVNACEMLVEGLASANYLAVGKTSAREALELLEHEDFDAVLTDLNMRGMNGIELCERVVANRPHVPVVVITAFGSLESAVAALRAGAEDYVTKPFDIEQLLHVLRRVLRTRDLREEVKRLRQVIAATRQFEELLGESPPMRALYDLVERVAPTDASVLITGESGTGKELIARALHRRSRRAGGPFIPINCAAMPEALLESELFGHVRGAFTDARSANEGLFAKASGGTLFLDEIGELPLSLQPKLLRALQQRAARPVGGTSEVPFDVRIVAATNRDLEAAIEEGRFREDLYYRLNVVQLDAPPLRARGTDVLLLAELFLRDAAARAGRPISGLSSSAAERILSYRWPGNVRELQNCIERAVALTSHDRVTVDDLPARVREYRRTHVLVGSDNPAELPPMAEVERRYIMEVMQAVDGNKTLAARVLGFDRKTLYHKLERYGLHPEHKEP